MFIGILVGMSPIRVWWLAIRPRTLPAATAPVLVGTAEAFRTGNMIMGPALAALVGALLIQIVSNLANDLFDFVKGADTEERLGPTRVTQAGLVSKRAIGTALLLCILLAILVGLYLVWIGGWPVVVIGVISLLCAVAYTGGPFPLGYLGLGELFVFIFFGPVAVAGTYYVQAHTFSSFAVLAGVPIGLLCANILVVNNVRDIDTDRKAGKRTLVVRLGRAFGERLYLADILLAVTALLLFSLLTKGYLALLACVVAYFVGKPLYESIRTQKGRELNPILGRTAQFELQFSLAMSLGIALSRLFMFQ
ncbi:1,4-dihydroxy-2-naphthoate polyprenyltransferase [soil metagenome]